MADPIALRQAVLAALRGIRPLNNRVYDGTVPTRVPEVGGYILPYVVLHAGVGDHPDEKYLDGTTGADGLIFDFQTNSVGPDSNQAAAVDHEVRQALTNLRLGTGRIQPNRDGFTQAVPIREDGATPTRSFMPRQWRLHTN